LEAVSKKERDNIIGWTRRKDVERWLQELVRDSGSGISIGMRKDSERLYSPNEVRIRNTKQRRLSREEKEGIDYKLFVFRGPTGVCMEVRFEEGAAYLKMPSMGFKRGSVLSTDRCFPYGKEMIAAAFEDCFFLFLFDSDGRGGWKYYSIKYIRALLEDEGVDVWVSRTSGNKNRVNVLVGKVTRYPVDGRKRGFSFGNDPFYGKTIIEALEYVLDLRGEGKDL